MSEKNQRPGILPFMSCKPIGIGSAEDRHTKPARRLFCWFATFAIITTTAWLALNSGKAPPPSPPASQPAGTLAVKTDDADIFRRAFWRRPDPGDRILHAERREWTRDVSQGISQWQWFLAGLTH
jgi:hypothetical protein